MKPFEEISFVLVLAGAFIILFSILLAVKIRKDVSEELRWKWMTAVSLMMFFLFGYVLFLYVLLDRASIPSEEVSGVVFFAGACFVYIVMRVSRTTILRISEKDRAIQSYAQGLTERTVALEQEITERMRAEGLAKSRLQNLSALHTIDMIISSSHDLEITLKVFLEQSVSRLQVDAACVLILDPNTQMLQYAAGIGFLSPQIQHTVQRVGEGIAGHAALDRRVVLIPDMRSNPEGFDRTSLAEEEDFVAYFAVPLIAKARVKGILEIFNRTRIDPDSEWLNFLKSLALQAAIAIDSTNLFDELQRSNIELLLAYDSTLEGWARTLELRDKETEGHTRRVVEKTLQVARIMGMKDEDLVHVRRGALLHDIGKMSIPDSILMKTGSLEEEEMEIMRHHPVYAFELLSPIVYLRPALDIPYCHHEKWDGTGYPRGLKGEQIPLAARIFAVVDMWDALRTERRYHSAWSGEETCRYILSLAGTHFDPKVVDVFLTMECGGKA
jgi:HD-GYP domain-containing protein (c-di-GMP phosphodiesterase class II)